MKQTKLGKMKNMKGWRKTIMRRYNYLSVAVEQAVYLQ